MTYTVTYRGKGGRQETLTLDVATRNDVFVELKKRGITAISVAVGAKSAASSRGASGRIRGIVAGLIVILGAVCAWWFLMRETPKPVEPEAPAKKIVKAPTTLPTPVAKPQTEAPVVEAPKPPERRKRFYEQPTTNGLTEAQIRIWKVKNRPPPGITNNTSRTEAPPKYAIFKHRSENTIAAYLSLTPGQTLVGSPHYDKKFVKDFLDSLDEPIVIKPEDDEETVALKQGMIATKADLKALYDKGEDIGKVLEETHEELRQLSQYKMQIESILKESIRSGELTASELELAIEAANKMLDEKGIAPMKFGPVSKQLMLRHVKPEN